jgi:hypothetical protein
MKFAADRPYADPEKAARKLAEIGNAIEPVLDAGSTSNSSPERPKKRPQRGVMH